MRKIIIGFTLVSLLAVSGAPVYAASKAKTYKNCTELNKDYPGGVAQSSKVKNKGGKTMNKPYVSKALYEANKKSDRDKDLIACEK